MSNNEAKRAAENIVNDRQGADYYKDLKILAEYLEGALGMAKDKAAKSAKAIHEDRNGANYYEDVDVLSDFLAK